MHDTNYWRFRALSFLVLFPIILSLWIAFFWAKSEVNNQLRTFAQLALDKSELVIRQADLVSDAAERYQGQVCTPAHQKRMLNIIRGYLYINELIYARDNHFLCSSLIASVNGYTIAPPIISANLTFLSIITVIRLFLWL